MEKLKKNKIKIKIIKDLKYLNIMNNINIE